MALGLGLALAGLGVGIGIQAFTQYQQGQLANQMHQYNRAVSLRYARAVREIRAYEETAFWREAAKVFPRQKVITAAAGLEVSGTPLKVMKATRLKLVEQAKIMQFEKEMEISKIKSEAAISGFRGQIAASAGKLGMWSTILTGAGQLGIAKYRYGG